MAHGNNSGISPACKTAILLVLFGVPLLFAGASWGLDKLFEVAPWVLVAILVLTATAYTARTSGLLYRYYNTQAPVLRFIPCLCELSLIDQKYRKPCYILYALAIVMALLAVVPYSAAKVLGDWFVNNHTFAFGMLMGVVMVGVQIVKGIGIAGCIKDVAEDWYQQTHSDVGLIKRFSPLGFIPFVRVVAMYSLSKPLETMVSFMGVDSEDVGSAETFEEEEPDGDYDYDEDDE